MNFLDPFGLLIEEIVVTARRPDTGFGCDDPGVTCYSADSVVLYVYIVEIDLGQIPHIGKTNVSGEVPQNRSQVNMVSCQGFARILEGNPDLVGEDGGFTGDTVGSFPVLPNSAAIDVAQFGGNKAALRPVLRQISGVTTGGQVFTSISDVIGSNVVADVRNVLKTRFPGVLLIELVSGKDEGVAGINLTLPSSIGCPSGTSLVR